MNATRAPASPMPRAAHIALLHSVGRIIGEQYVTPEAEGLLWAIGRQEGRMIHRRQIGGPARGLYQFEKGGGVAGVLKHPASKKAAEALCIAREVEARQADVYNALEQDDVLACGFARLLLYTDPAPLPKLAAGRVQEAWMYYKRNWRPGKPHRITWDNFWREAVNGGG